MASLRHERHSHDVPDYFSHNAISRRTILLAEVARPKIRAAKLESASGSSIRVSRDFSNNRSISSVIEPGKY